MKENCPFYFNLAPHRNSDALRDEPGMLVENPEPLPRLELESIADRLRHALGLFKI